MRAQSFYSCEENICGGEFHDSLKMTIIVEGQETPGDLQEYFDKFSTLVNGKSIIVEGHVFKIENEGQNHVEFKHIFDAFGPNTRQPEREFSNFAETVFELWLSPSEDSKYVIQMNFSFLDLEDTHERHTSEMYHTMFHSEEFEDEELDEMYAEACHTYRKRYSIGLRSSNFE